MVLRRYLVFFSYTGTYFSGLQRQTSRTAKYNEDPSTVQGLIEYAVSRLKPKNNIVMHLSSRTDQGVHALKNSCSFDLDFDNDINLDDAMIYLNTFFCKTDLDIRILEIIRVNSNFEIRSNVLWRKYLYKFAVLKPDALPGQPKRTDSIPISATDVRRCYYLPHEDFQVDRVKEMANMFVGTKDFLSFQSKVPDQPPEISSIRTMLSVDITPSSSCLPFTYDYYNYWDITVCGKSFLYKQVRRMVAVLIAVGFGRLQPSTVQNMFENPSNVSWPDNVAPAPSHGLYLVEVKYDPESVIFTEAEQEKNSYEDPAVKLERKEQLIKEKLRQIELLKKQLPEDKCN